MRNTMVRRCALIVVLLLAVLAGGPAGLRAQPFSDEAIAQVIRAALLAYFDPPSLLTVSVANARVSGETLAIAQLTVDGRPVYLRGIPGEVFFQASDLELESAPLARQQLSVRRARTATLVARSTAAAMAQALARMSSTILDPRVRFHAGEFEVTATVRRDGTLYPAQVRGTLVVHQGRQVRVAIARLTVAGGAIPEGTIERELLKINPLLDLARYPLDLRIQRLTLHDDRIELLAVSGR